MPTAYALARFEFVGKEGGVRALLATQMFPAVASAIPLYIILDGLGLLGTRSGLVLCYATTAVPFAIFQLRGAFETIPRDLEEAAMVDGATRFEAFRKVVLPAARPVLLDGIVPLLHERAQDADDSLVVERTSDLDLPVPDGAAGAANRLQAQRVAGAQGVLHVTRFAHGTIIRYHVRATLPKTL